MIAQLDKSILLRNVFDVYGKKKSQNLIQWINE